MYLFTLGHTASWRTIVCMQILHLLVPRKTNPSWPPRLEYTSSKGVDTCTSHPKHHKGVSLVPEFLNLITRCPFTSFIPIYIPAYLYTHLRMHSKMRKSCHDPSGFLIIDIYPFVWPAPWRIQRCGENCHLWDLAREGSRKQREREREREFES